MDVGVEKYGEQVGNRKIVVTLAPLPTMWPGASHVNSQSLCILISKMGVDESFLGGLEELLCLKRKL